MIQKNVPDFRFEGKMNEIFIKCLYELVSCIGKDVRHKLLNKHLVMFGGWYKKVNILWRYLKNGSRTT